MKVETAVGALLRMVSLKLPRLPGNRVVEFGEGVANVLPSHIMINNTMPKQQNLRKSYDTDENSCDIHHIWDCSCALYRLLQHYSAGQRSLDDSSVWSILY